MTPKVWHVRDSQKPIGTVYVGRPTIWGNPFVIRRDGTRKEVIEKYRQYVLAMPARQREKFLLPLKGKHLSCWCAPLACHAGVLIEFANKECK